MEHAFAELPLAIFTTLAPISAGTFVALAIAFLTTKFADEQLKRIDKLSWIPLALLIIGFIAAFFHLTQVMSAVGVFAGVGRSPLSNELAAAVVFFILAVVYCALALAGKLTRSSRKIFSVILAVVAFVFALFLGLAYMIETISSWNTALVPLQVIGFFLLGGGVLGVLILSSAGGLKEAKTTSFKPAMLVVLIAGLLLSAVCLGMQVALVAGMTSLVADGSLIVAEIMVYAVAAIALLVIACIGGCIALLKGDMIASALSCVVVVIAVFIARLVFYAMQINVGL